MTVHTALIARLRDMPHYKLIIELRDNALDTADPDARMDDALMLAAALAIEELEERDRERKAVIDDALASSLERAEARVAELERDVKRREELLDQYEGQWHDAEAQVAYEQERNANNVAMADMRVAELEKALLRMCDALERGAEPTHGDIDGWRMSTVQHPREWPMVKDARAALLASSDTTPLERDAKNTLTIRTYRAEDRLDALAPILAAACDWAAAYRSGLLRGSHVTEERLLAAVSEICMQTSDKTTAEEVK